ncbi:lipopolysaccharide heptosyltransferase II [Psychromonas sp. KJ10-10]|uniref:lipopolysaccharide heptosyltransferase II n=1 Tax=Psychromonas sp. KJ10-10 TaxID=3391823 RepID=UPI0039B5BC0B
MKILVIGPSWVGDMVMSQCLYKLLKQRYPEAQLDVLAPNWCSALLSRMPEVDNALTMPIGHGSMQLSLRYKIGKELAGIYDWAIIQPNSFKSAFIPLFAGIKKRTAWKGESRYFIINDLRSNRDNFPLMIERYGALAFDKKDMVNNKALPKIPYPSLTVNETQRQQAINKLQLSLDKKILGLCPGAEFGPAKRWPDSYYAQVAQERIEAGWQVWIFGGEKDQQVGELIRSQISENLQSQCINLAGKTSLSEAVDLLSLPQVVVSNDSGLMHIAATHNRPLVAIYGSSSPKYTPPLCDHVQSLYTDIECRPCFKKQCKFGHIKCLTEILPMRVISSIKLLMAEK